MCKVHITSQELQAAVLMLQRLTFQLSGKMVTLNVDNNTAKAFLCNQSDIVCSFFILAHCILNLVDKCGITHIPV